MLTYNFSYPHHQGISSTYHYPYSTSSSGNTLVLNFSMPDSYYYDDDDDGNSDIGNTGIDKGTVDKIDKGTGGKNGKGTGDKTDKGTVDETGKGTSDDDAAAKKKADDDAAAKEKAEDDAAAKKKADDDAAAKKKVEDDAAAKKKVEDDAAAKKKVEDDAAAKKKAEDDAAAKKNADEDDAGIITSQEITSDHIKSAQCGDFSRIYKTEKLVGHQGFNTHDLLKFWHPKMYNNTEIIEHIKDGTYGAANYVFAFTSNLRSTLAVPSDISCEKCASKPEHPACKNNEFKSLCFDSGVTGHSKNYFTKVCPNLISESKEMSDIKAKQVSPLILVNSSGEMIDRDGNNTQAKYSSLKPYLESNGRVKDCAGDTECKKFAEIMKKVVWETDKVILLKTSDNAGKTSAYSSDIENQDIPPSDNNFV